MEKHCMSCLHFHDCLDDKVDFHGYCSTDRSVLGFCELWEGAIDHDRSRKACTSWECETQDICIEENK
jgi:hypothetical protein